MTSSFSSARWWSIATLVLCLFGAAATVSAQADAEEQARGHFRLGRAHYDNGDFLRAAQEFEAAFAISLHSQLLYNIYLAYRDANVTSKAAEALKGYLEQVADVPNRAQLAARLESLQQALANSPQQTATPTPPDGTTPAVTPTTAPTEAAAPTETADATAVTATTDTTASSGGGGNKLIPLILMGTGGAFIIGGVITGIMTSGKESDLSTLCPDMTCSSANGAAGKDLQSSGNTLALVTDILLFTGIAAAGTGAVLFLLSGSEESSEPPATTASFMCAPGMCAGAFQTRF